jgi:putrescine transport system permease protein
MRAVLLAGYAFLYLPIALMVAFSCNDSRLLTVWTGFSWRWYAALWQDQALVGAAVFSLRIALAAASLATVVGTAAGIALARGRRTAGYRLFAGTLAVPLVMPDVVVGLSLLLLFVALGISRGAGTITLAHASFALAYVAVVVQGRLADAGTGLEEAAADLGASPPVAFATITLPLLAPALASGWLLAFTLSLDDVVVASFVSGPGATTLPMVLFSQLRLGPTPEVFALATVVLGVVLACLLLAWAVPAMWGRRPPMVAGPGAGA